MRLPLLYVSILAFFHVNLAAQKLQPSFIKYEVSEKGIYRFPGFTDGTIIFRNGIISPARLNYNISLDEMHFINQNGDTLSLAEPTTISFISMNGTRFYYDNVNGYLQTIDTAGDVILSFKQGFITQQLRPGAYGTTIPHEGARTYSYFTGNGQKFNLGQDEKITVTTKEYYFFGDQYGHFTKACKEFILLHFDKHQPEIKSFLKARHINFNDLEDLLQLMQYCSTLTS